jgi:hypothetical protein
VIAKDNVSKESKSSAGTTVSTQGHGSGTSGISTSADPAGLPQPVVDLNGEIGKSAEVSTSQAEVIPASKAEDAPAPAPVDQASHDELEAGISSELMASCVATLLLVQVILMTKFKLNSLLP